MENEYENEQKAVVMKAEGPDMSVTPTTDSRHPQTHSRAGVWAVVVSAMALLYVLSVPAVRFYYPHSPLFGTYAPIPAQLYLMPWDWLAYYTPLRDPMGRYEGWYHSVLSRWKYEGHLQLW